MFKVWRLPLAAGALSLLLTMISCGGGSSTTASNGSSGGGVGSGGTGSYTSGPISGLGSIIVNNVRFDVSSATVVSDDDADTSAHSAADLKLGVVVEVQGSGLTAGATASSLATGSAVKVRYASALVGKVTQVLDTSCLPSACIKVLGQKVLVSTSIDQPASMALNDVVEVYGVADADGVYTATRIERPATAPSVFKIAGTLLYVDTTAKTVTIGQAGAPLTVDFSGSVNSDTSPAWLVPGARVRLWCTEAGASYVGVKLKQEAPLVKDEDEARLEGRITGLPYGTSHIMKVNGSPVDVSQITFTVAPALGDRVRFDGSLQDGVLIANEYYAGAALPQEGTELHGSVTQLDASAHTFTVRGVGVSYLPSVVHGNLALAEGRCVEVHGQGRDAYQRLIATEIEVQDSCTEH
jgi:hypothetical protein